MKPSRLAFALSTVVLAAATAVAQGKGSLRIAAIDVEGGQATLFIAPTGQSLLVDTGWPGRNGRDADRIVAAAKEMGLTRIDTVLLTHYHTDHAGGVPQLVDRIPVGTFLDHGDRYPQDPNSPQDYDDYLKVIASGKSKRVTVKAGDKLPIAGFDAIAISSAGKVMDAALPGAGKPNALCANAPAPAEDTQENGQSLGILLRFAGLKIVDGGDLTSDRERMLVCPANKIGPVDLMIVSHHGIDWSSSPIFIKSLAPRVAIMDNGSRKGASTSVIDTLRSSPRIEALYQLHLAPPAGSPNPGGTKQEGPDHNVPDEFLANPAGTDGKRIDITITPNGAIDVRNERTGDTKHFPRG
ncbi:putative hydrolase (metallo-beta-lactamase superfamily) [Terriglobus roseus DSM 18391]|uniref:Putative hydrolase (Metallo-beta-lactamase superfamily) n=1 Tax=Terriglobus roseus (strain DSM 18391 / NRRL B-41598 / KBS 63) TaxID=926566 RepID=I3ZBE1_TERRK|nr:MBL fold metallo-hydrolase [Terriglobus roseus]AFL86559.1 putative hydrolase (metallo-beta-lactamase superfamily) [Terriglobus roseus DSM 18391]